MHFLKRIFAAAAVALPLASSLAIDKSAVEDLERRASDVTVTLSSVEHAVVKASIKNNAAETYKLLKAGTFLDAAPVSKATVFKDGEALPFKGILLRSKLTGLTEDAFTSLAPGATLEGTFDLASVTDLSAGGVFEVIAEGAIPLASADSTELSGSKVAFRSNKLSINVDGAFAAKVAPAIHLLDDRTVLTSCSGSANTALRQALSQAVTLANNAATAATSGSTSKFQEYFKTTSSSTRSTVAARFRGVATQAGSTTSGGTRYYCNDPYGYCDPK